MRVVEGRGERALRAKPSRVRLHDRDPPLRRCKRKLGATRLRAERDVGPAGQQRAHNLRVRPSCSDVKRRLPAGGARGVRIHAGSEQQLDNSRRLCPLLSAGNEEGRSSVRD